MYGGGYFIAGRNNDYIRNLNLQIERKKKETHFGVAFGRGHRADFVRLLSEDGWKKYETEPS